MKCPECKYVVVWRFVSPHKNDYCCRRCGHHWRAQLEEAKGRFGMFLGRWTSELVALLEVNLANVKMKDDWNFFRGNAIFTAWRDSEPEQLITVETLDELIYWVANATNRKDWYQHFEKTYSISPKLVAG